MLTEKRNLVFKSIAESDYNFRTVNGIVKETGLSEAEVLEVTISLLHRRDIHTTWSERNGRMFYLHNKMLKNWEDKTHWFDRLLVSIAGSVQVTF